MLGIWDIEFSNKWFMVTIVMKEVADSNNVLAYNRASCKMYVNGVKLLDKKVETKYVNNVYSATFKNNSSPLYVNPVFTPDIVKESKNPYNKVADIFPRMRSLTEDDLYSIAGHILVSPRILAEKWGGGKIYY